MGMELTEEEMKEVMEIDCDSDPLSAAKEASDSASKNDNGQVGNGRKSSVPSDRKVMPMDEKDAKVDIPPDGNDNTIEHEKKDPLSILLNPNVLKKLANPEGDDNLDKENDSDRIADSPKSSNKDFEPDSDVFKSPVSKRHKTSTFKEISNEFSSPKSKPTTPRTP